MNKNLKVVLGVVILLFVLVSCVRTLSTPDYVGEWESIEDGYAHEWVEFTKDKMIVSGKEYDIEAEEKGESSRIKVKDVNGDVQIDLIIAFKDKDNATVYAESTFSDAQVFDIVRK